MLNNPTQYCPAKQKGSNCLELRKMAFIYLGLAVTANMTPIFSNTQYNGGRILVYMIKHVFNVSKMTLTHFQPNEQLLPFCLEGQNMLTYKPLTNNTA